MVQSVDTQTIGAAEVTVSSMTPHLPETHFSVFLIFLFSWLQALNIWAQSVGECRTGWGQNQNFCKNKFPLQSVTNENITLN